MKYLLELKQDLESKIYFNNSLYDFVIAFLLFSAIILAITLFIRFFLKRFEIEDKIHNPFLATFVEILRTKTVYITYALAVYGALTYLSTPTIVAKFIDKAIIVYIVFILVLSLVDMLSSYNSISMTRTGQKAMPSVIVTILKVIVWICGLLFIFSNLGYDVSTFITGLGIGGIAVALASQNILGDLFNYLVILFDKPFAKGDSIQFNTYLGRVENVGIKSTKIRSANGELLFVSNTDLTKTIIHNFEKAEKRRHVSIIGVEYETNVDIVHSIPQLLEDAVRGVEEAEFSRVHFATFNSSSLDFELVYFILSNDYNEFVNGVQKVNFAILDAFALKGINFAYPTQRMINK